MFVNWTRLKTCGDLPVCDQNENDITLFEDNVLLFYKVSHSLENEVQMKKDEANRFSLD